MDLETEVDFHLKKVKALKERIQGYDDHELLVGYDPKIEELRRQAQSHINAHWDEVARLQELEAE